MSADDLERVLNFQEALALVEGVTNITLIGAPEGRAHLVVELGEVAKAAVDPTIVCAWCGRLIAEGGAQVSHGLCPDCAARVFEQRPPER
ncbi:MAG: hypothetical protein ACREN5_08705 [Gemmatimonadales bacterium]